MRSQFVVAAAAAAAKMLCMAFDAESMWEATGRLNVNFLCPTCLISSLTACQSHQRNRPFVIADQHFEHPPVIIGSLLAPDSLKELLYFRCPVVAPERSTSDSGRL